jgi:3-hydroxybutyryl-CoA dehydrogenase
VTARTGADPTIPGTVAVVGGGTMGAGIAHAFLLAGSEVVLIEADPAAAERARERVARAVHETADRGLLSEPQAQVMTRLRIGTALSEAAPAGLAVEAVPENAALKVSVLAGLEAVLGTSAVVATNTSSLSIDELGVSLERPELLVGLHFFNPVPSSKLVEVVTARATSAGVARAATSWVEQIGKTPIVVRSSPGFASSRLGVALGLEAIRMVAEGVASAADIDTAMTLGYRHPIGPLRLTDLVGLDVRLSVAEYLTRTLGPRFAPPDLLLRKVQAGELGRKTGRGFYDWPAIADRKDAS